MSWRPLRVKTPCPTADPGFELRADGTRYCRTCRETTHDLRDATRAEVDALMRASGGKLCAVVRIGPSGEARFRGEPPPRGLSTVGGAALALAVAACQGPDEPALAPEPPATLATPPPSTAIEAPPPPSSSLPAAPAAPETSVMAPPTTVAADGIDHSTDTSTSPVHHQAHHHRHAPTPIDGDPSLAVGGLG